MELFSSWAISHLLNIKERKNSALKALTAIFHSLIYHLGNERNAEKNLAAFMVVWRCCTRKMGFCLLLEDEPQTKSNKSDWRACYATLTRKGFKNAHSRWFMNRISSFLKLQVEKLKLKTFSSCQTFLRPFRVHQIFCLWSNLTSNIQTQKKWFPCVPVLKRYTQALTTFRWHKKIAIMLTNPSQNLEAFDGFEFFARVTKISIPRQNSSKEFFIRNSCMLTCVNFPMKNDFSEKEYFTSQNDFLPDLFASSRAKSFTNSFPVVIYKVFKFVLSVSWLLLPSPLFRQNYNEKKVFHPLAHNLHLKLDEVPAATFRGVIQYNCYPKDVEVRFYEFIFYSSRLRSRQAS